MGMFSKFLFVFLLLFIVEAKAQQISPGGTAAPAYPNGFDTIDATQQAGADMCAKIAAAGAKLTATGPTIVDATGFTSPPYTCSGSMFSGWPASTVGNWGLIWGNQGNVISSNAQTIPQNVVVTSTVPDPIWGPPGSVIYAFQPIAPVTVSNTVTVTICNDSGSQKLSTLISGNGTNTKFILPGSCTFTQAVQGWPIVPKTGDQFVGACHDQLPQNCASSTIFDLGATANEIMDTTTGPTNVIINGVTIQNGVFVPSNCGNGSVIEYSQLLNNYGTTGGGAGGGPGQGNGGFGVSVYGGCTLKNNLIKGNGGAGYAGRVDSSVAGTAGITTILLDGNEIANNGVTQSLTNNTTTSGASAVLHFSSGSVVGTLIAACPGCLTGAIVTDETTHHTFKNGGGNNFVASATATTVTLTVNVDANVGSGDTISFHNDYNNGGGGGKITQGDGTCTNQPTAASNVRVIYRNNYVHDNYGIGAWWDTCANNALIYGNTFDNNRFHDIQGELSRNLEIFNNVFTCNGGNADNPFIANALFLSTSTDVLVHDNNFCANSGGTKNAMELVPGQERASAIGRGNIHFYRNTASFKGASGTGIWGWEELCGAYPGQYCYQHPNITSDYNSFYTASTLADTHFFWNGSTTAQSFATYQLIGGQSYGVLSVQMTDCVNTCSGWQAGDIITVLQTSGTLIGSAATLQAASVGTLPSGTGPTSATIATPGLYQQVDQPLGTGVGSNGGRGGNPEFNINWIAMGDAPAPDAHSTIQVGSNTPAGCTSGAGCVGSGWAPSGVGVSALNTVSPPFGPNWAQRP